MAPGSQNMKPKPAWLEARSSPSFRSRIWRPGQAAGPAAAEAGGDASEAGSEASEVGTKAARQGPKPQEQEPLSKKLETAYGRGWGRRNRKGEAATELSDQEPSVGSCGLGRKTRAAQADGEAGARAAEGAGGPAAEAGADALELVTLGIDLHERAKGSLTVRRSWVQISPLQWDPSQCVPERSQGHPPMPSSLANLLGPFR
jgi:hypothetical protein